MSMEGQTTLSRHDTGTLPLSDKISHLLGTAEVVLLEPDQSKGHLVLIAESGDWRIRVGSHIGQMPAAYAPSGSISDAGAVGIKSGSGIVIQSPDRLTVRGYDPAGVLTYYWV